MKETRKSEEVVQLNEEGKKRKKLKKKMCQTKRKYIPTKCFLCKLINFSFYSVTLYTKNQQHKNICVFFFIYHIEPLSLVMQDVTPLHCT